MIKITKILKKAVHRNGVAGAPFTVVLFEDETEGEKSTKIAILFREKGHVAVFDKKLLAQGIIEFGKNSWRGDRYEDALRKLNVGELDEIHAIKAKRRRSSNW